MNSIIGVWINYRKAVIVDNEDIRLVLSHIKLHIRNVEKLHENLCGDQQEKWEDKVEKHFWDYLNRYYDKVILNLRNDKSLLIFGPGKAKSGLKSRLAHYNLDKRILQIEQIDSAALRRIVADIRDYIRDRRTNYEYASAGRDDQ